MATLAQDRGGGASSVAGRPSAPSAQPKHEEEDDESDDSLSSRSNVSYASDNGDNGQGGLFIASTISRDDTLKKTTKQRSMLSQLNDQLIMGAMQLNSSMPPLGRIPPPPPPLAIGRRPYPLVPGRGPPPPGWRGGPPPGVRPPPPLYRGGPPLAMRRHNYPTMKVNTHAYWRRKAMKDRGIWSGSSDSDDDADSESESVPKKDLAHHGGNTSEQKPLPEIQVEGLPDPSPPPENIDAASSLPKGNNASGEDKSGNSNSGMAGAAEGNDKAQQVEKHPGGNGESPEKQDAQDSSDASGSTPSSNGGPDPPEGDPPSDDSKSSKRKEGPKKGKGKKTPDEEGLAEKLHGIAEQFLKVDVLDQTSDVSRFIAYLFDTIQMLENQVRFAQASDDSSSDSGSDDETRSQVPSVPRIQVLHRIFCTNSIHNHDRCIYEDEPALRQSVAFDGDSGLQGKVEINNVDTYLNRHPDICFVVFKEHDCALEQRMMHRRLWLSAGGNGSVSSGRKERMRIVSPTLQKALTQIAEFQVYDDPDQDLDEVKEMDAPYPFLFHHRKKLAVLAEQSTYKEVLTPLLAFLTEKYEPEYQKVEEMVGKGLITAFHIGMLFKPNQMVVVRKSSGLLEAYVLSNYATLEREKLSLRGWAWQYNGTELQRRSWHGTIDNVPEDETPISDLTIHPADHARTVDTEKLEGRGQRFWEMRGQTYTCYTGWDKGREHYYVSQRNVPITDARFMVDVATYQLMHHSAISSSRERDEPSKFDPWPTSIHRREEKLPAKASMLLPAITYGFNLHDKKWVILNIEDFHPIDWNKKAFDRLVLDSKTKEMIYALVDVQTSAKKMDDIITGKGNGLIILLHGSPGTGKTLTAESVAEIAEKPLYRVTCGDIGTEARDVEKYLQTVLYLGKTWDCVLLLDEADVFLEERTMADLQRNSLVSVFLRILEYYEGILILTSNRVGTFDEAFKSRIQVAIHYDNLTKKSRKAIWQNFFDMIEENDDEDANMPELERRLDELAAEEMNGRQIRNALLTARQLAKHRKERLDWEHLSQVMKTSAAFNKYLKAVRGHSDDQWAREEMLR